MASHLLFAFNGTRYAIAAQGVRSICWLPELSPVEDLPPYFVGLINLHHEVIPIIDLGQRFGHPPAPYRLDQAMILLEQGDYRLGLVADQVQDLVEIAPAAIAPYVQLEAGPWDAAAPVTAAPVIAGTVKWDDGVLILLDAATLLTLAMQVPEQPMRVGEGADRFAGLTPQEREQLRRRTHHLALSDTPPAPDGRHYALVRIGPARYAIALERVAEFAHLGVCTPIPCCPPHILGCVNLRGAILIVMDLAPLLQGASASDYRDLAVLRLGDLRLGLAVHQIIDVCAFTDQAFTTLKAEAYGHPHCRRALRHEEGVAGVLDFDLLLQQGLFDVNEQV